MTDKDIKDYCKNCSVEPPAMKFKCPECEHNPDKEQVIQGTNYKKELEHYQEEIRTKLIDIQSRMLALHSDILDLSVYVQSGIFL